MCSKIIAFTALFVFCLTLKAESSVDINIMPEISILRGSAAYEMDYYESFFNYSTYPPTTIDWRINSLLEFPVSTNLGGIKMEIRPQYDRNKWSIQVSYSTSFSETKSEKMKDSDGESVETFFPFTVFSYTESDADFAINIFEIGLQYRLSKQKKFDLSLILDTKFQIMHYDILGYEGWYRVFDTTALEYYTDSTIGQGGYQDTVVMKYKLKTGMIALGLQSNLFIHSNLKSTIKAAYAPTFFSDVDDHVLRFKESKSNGIGHGFNGELRLEYLVPFMKYSKVELFTRMHTFKADGSQFQYWYDYETTTDPETGNIDLLVPKGAAIGNIPHQVRVTQYQYGFRLHLVF